MGAGAVLVGATLLSTNSSLLSNGNSGSGGGNTVSVTVKEIHPTTTITAPADDDVYFTSSLTASVNYVDSITFTNILTAPNGSTCSLTPVGISDLSGTYTLAINLTECQGGAKGEYHLTAYPIGYANAGDTVTFYYASFSIGTIFNDNNGDPLVMVNYGAGIKKVLFDVTCAGTTVLDDYAYATEENEDYIDEVLLPLKDKNVAKGTACTLQATAAKSDGTAVGGSAGTASKTFTYAGLPY